MRTWVRKHTDKEPETVIAHRPNMVPRVPRTEEVYALCGRGTCACLRAKRGERLVLLAHHGLSVHWHVNQEGQSVSNLKSFLDSPRVLSQALVPSVLGGIPRGPSEHDAPHAAKVGIVDLQVQHLARDAGHDRVRGAQVNPWADARRVRIDRGRREQRGVLGGQRRQDGFRPRGRDGAGARLAILAQQGEVVRDELEDPLLDVVVGDGRRREADLRL